jgi:Mn2+/Fe2+ NRAMP family transporter
MLLNAEMNGIEIYHLCINLPSAWTLSEFDDMEYCSPLKKCKFGFKFGLYRKLKEASAFYGVIIIAMVLGILLNFVGFDPIQVLIYSAVFNGLISPIMLFLIVRISSNEKIMGEYKNKNLSRGMGWLTVVLMSMVSVASIFFLLDVF